MTNDKQLPKGCNTLFWVLVIGFMVITFLDGLRYCAIPVGR
jgi:hypothetical protein